MEQREKEVGKTRKCINQPLFDRMPGQFRGGSQPELPLDIFPMKGNGLNGYFQEKGDFLGSAPLGNQLQNLALPGAQAERGGRARGILEALQMLVREAWRDVYIAGHDAADRLEQFLAGTSG